MSFIDLGEDVADVILHFRPGLGGYDPASSALEYDAVNLHPALLSSGAKHGELLGLHNVIYGLASARTLADPACCCGFAKLVC